MVTASHNPPKDNGYKVYLGTGGQITPPIDQEIAACIAAVGPVSGIPLAAPDSSLIVSVGQEIIDAYLDAAVATTFVPGARDVRVAYTALHGVGRDVALAAFERAGFPAPHSVLDQGDPDPDFPTVAFPNPEEPGAMDHLLALAAAVDADVAIANDPDADRLGVAVPDPDAPGGWRALRGDHIGWMIAEHVLAHTEGSDRLVVTTVVSSSLLSHIAQTHGVHHREVLTGFKWIARAALDNPELQFVFGYEEALGFLVGTHVYDKDGIGAALVFAEIAALAKAEGTTLLGRLRDIEARYGAYRTGQHVVRMVPADAAAAVQRLVAAPPTELAGIAVTEATFRADADLLTLRLGAAGRVMLRPSGTEPKLKIYAEAIDGDPAPAGWPQRCWRCSRS
jgi:phosphomannomutase